MESKASCTLATLRVTGPCWHEWLSEEAVKADAGDRRKEGEGERLAWDEDWVGRGWALEEENSRPDNEGKQAMLSEFETLVSMLFIKFALVLHLVPLLSVATIKPTLP
ncbi:hypothetical protein BDN70DRAFT_18181 [Pholiota conissans]|uniref:Uncharacterized protein n=1 Tax=Pholiota conissans TaxID=109636 RepID=A0A9P5ZFJ4_9AGAR|nr:hypothetical protein BDN70DRAFT_18181 [Pholiota conissans]